MPASEGSQPGLASKQDAAPGRPRRRARRAGPAPLPAQTAVRQPSPADRTLVVSHGKPSGQTPPSAQRNPPSVMLGLKQAPAASAATNSAAPKRSGEEPTSEPGAPRGSSPQNCSLAPPPNSPPPTQGVKLTRAVWVASDEPPVIRMMAPVMATAVPPMPSTMAARFAFLPALSMTGSKTGCDAVLRATRELVALLLGAQPLEDGDAVRDRAGADHRPADHRARRRGRRRRRRHHRRRRDGRRRRGGDGHGRRALRHRRRRHGRGRLAPLLDQLSARDLALDVLAVARVRRRAADNAGRTDRLRG